MRSWKKTSQNVLFELSMNSMELDTSKFLSISHRPQNPDSTYLKSGNLRCRDSDLDSITLLRSRLIGFLFARASVWSLVLRSLGRSLGALDHEVEADRDP